MPYIRVNCLTGSLTPHRRTPLAVDRSRHCCPKLRRRWVLGRSAEKRLRLNAGNFEVFHLRAQTAPPSPVWTVSKANPGNIGSGRMSHKFQDIGVARQIAAYSDAVEVKSNLRWLLTSGTPGLSKAGNLPEDISGQAELAWQHIVEILKRADMQIADAIKVTQYLTRAEDIPSYGRVRARFLGELRPASMLLIVPQLVRPEFLVEIEVIAARD
jgi:2-iminobutanoate/2-iminopropanoate deaminase